MNNHTEDDMIRGDWEADCMKDRLMEERWEEQKAERAKIPTPRTDALRRYCNEACAVDDVAVDQVLNSHDHLERELAEARAEADLWKTWESETGVKRDEALRLYLEVTKQRDRLVKWIVQHPPKYDGDHACAECYPFSVCLVDGFQCAYHEALATVEGGSHE